MSFDLHHKIDDTALERDEFAISGGECDMRVSKFCTFWIGANLANE